MGKKRHRKRRVVEGAPRADGGGSVSHPDQAQTARPGRRWKRWAGRAALVVLTPLLVLGLAELVLRWSGFGYPSEYFLRDISGKEFYPNPNYDWQFYLRTTGEKARPFRMPASKPAGTSRIFVMGESAAIGTPSPAYSFSRVLDVMLKEAYPEARYEIFNVAMRGINSHIIRRIALECAEHEPDLLILYMGNNEAVGIHAPGPESSFLDERIWLIRALERVKSARLGQWLASLILPEQPMTQDQEFFRQRQLAWDDPDRERIYDFFERNLGEIIEANVDAGAGILLCTVPVDVADFPPFGSLHGSGLDSVEETKWRSHFEEGEAARKRGDHQAALREYQAAEQLDSAPAKLHFRLGQTFSTLGKLAEARRHFYLARDRDTLQFRVDSRLNKIIRKSGEELSFESIRLVDLEKTFSQSPLSTKGMPGENFFYEHVHLRFEGNWLIGRALLPEVGENLGWGAPGAKLDLEACRRSLAFTTWDELQSDMAMAQALAHPPFLDRLDREEELAELREGIQSRSAGYGAEEYQEDLRSYAAAIRERPDDWELHYSLGTMLFALKQYEAAVDPFSRVVQRFPEWPAFRQPLAASLARAGRVEDAKRHLRAALELDPKFEVARESLRKLGGKTP